MFIQQNSLSSLQTSNISESFIDTENSQLLLSRLSNVQIQEMSIENLLSKLLELHQILQQTQKDNEMLRIQKAQLRSQLGFVKKNAQQFIQENILYHHHHQKNNQNPKNNISNKFYQKQYENQEDDNVENLIYHNEQQQQYQLQSQIEPNLKNNKVFVRSNKEVISNNCIPAKCLASPQSKQYKSTLNSPMKKKGVNSPSISNFQSVNSSDVKMKKYNKIIFPKEQYENLILLQRQQNEKEAMENQTLENFESFYYPKDRKNQNKQIYKSLLQNQQTRRGFGFNNNSIQKNQRFVKKQHMPNDYNQLANQRRKLNFEQNNNNNKVGELNFYNNNNQYNQYHQNNNYNFNENDTSRTLNRSASSSNFSTDKKGYTIPHSIQDIWNSGSNERKNENLMFNYQHNNGKLNKTHKNNIKSGVMTGKRSYLNHI